MTTVKAKEWVSGPGKYVEKEYTFAELRETFGPGDLVWSLMDEVERLRTELAALRARVAAAEADAARYRFLRGRVEDYDGFACFESIPYPAPIPDRAPFNSIDDAVDTAMRAAADRASASASPVQCDCAEFCMKSINGRAPNGGECRRTSARQGDGR